MDERPKQAGEHKDGPSGCAISAAVVIIVIIVGGVFTASGFVPNRELTTGIVVFAASLFGVSGFFYARILREERYWLARALIIVFVVTLAAGIGMSGAGFYKNRFRYSRLSSAERGNLRIQKGAAPPRIEHPIFGFSFPKPGSNMKPRSLIQMTDEIILHNKHSHSWGYESSDGKNRVVVYLYTGNAGIEDDFDFFCESMKNMHEKVAAFSLVNSSAEWHGDSGEFNLDSIVGGVSFSQIRCLASGPAGKPRPHVVCINITSTEPYALRHIIEKFQIRKE